MNAALRVLFVDDSEADVELIQRELRSAGRLAMGCRVSDEPTMRAALDAGPWDIVLCDSSMPGFGAAAALAVLAGKGLSTPMIAVSGSADPSAPDSAMRLGARGYVHKGRLEHLVPTIDRELRATRAPAAPTVPASTESAPRVLLVDDDPALLRAYKNALTWRGCVVQAASSAAEALAQVGTGAFNVIVSDLNMPEMDGLQFLREIRKRDLDIPVVLMTGQPALDSALRAMEYGALRYLVKPVDPQTIEDVVRQGARLHQLGQWKREAFRLHGAADQGPGDRAGLETRFESALDQLWMAYQPIVRWPERTVFAYETLVRTREPTLRNPAEFLDAAERLGRLQELGRAIRSSVARDAARAPADLHLFVNLHSADLNDDELYLSEAPLSRLAARVVFEVTERASLEGVRHIDRSVAQLRERGFRVAIDDLGAGYAGLSSFTLLEPAIAKLDMSLVRNVDTDVRRQRIVHAMARLCGDLGMLVVAEGVERAGERDVLVDLGCDLLQGYLFARPEAGFPAPRWQ